MMTTEVVGKGDGDKSHFWSGVAPAVQKSVCTIGVGSRLLNFRIIDLQITIIIGPP